MNDTILVARDQILDLITRDEILQVVEDVYAAHGRGNVSMPTKITLNMSASGEPNWSNAMPAYIPEMEAAGIKWAGGYLHNPSRRQLDYVQATMILNDPLTGLPLAIMDAGAITTLRTGATAAVAASWLARSDSKRLVMFGAGAQGRSTAQMIDARCPFIEEFLVYDVYEEYAQSFVREIQPQVDFKVTVATDPEEAVRMADVIVTATTANKPLVMKDWVQPGTLIVTLGSYQELDPEIVLGADVLIVDDRDQCLTRGELVPVLESGELDPERVNTEIGEVIVGSKDGRRNRNDIIVADLIGLGSIDIACARRIYERIRDSGEAMTFSFY